MGAAYKYYMPQLGLENWPVSIYLWNLYKRCSAAEINFNNNNYHFRFFDTHFKHFFNEKVKLTKIVRVKIIVYRQSPTIIIGNGELFWNHILWQTHIKYSILSEIIFVFYFVYVLQLIVVLDKSSWSIKTSIFYNVGHTVF